MIRYLTGCLLFCVWVEVTKGLPTASLDNIPAPKRFSTNPYPGENMDRALGGKKKGKEAPKPSRYPWDASQKQPKNEPTTAMKEFMVAGETPFPPDYYDDYDFEFAKGGIRNDNFETKHLRDQEKKMQEPQNEDKDYESFDVADED